MIKRCNWCITLKQLDEFSPHSSCLFGVASICKKCKNLTCRLLRRKDGYRKHSAKCKKYEKTIGGYLMRMYRNMLSRVRGIQKAKAHLYKGKHILPKKQFYEWAYLQSNYFMLWGQYKESNWDMKFAPSINRIDSRYGYKLNNIEIITHSENSKLGNAARWNNLHA